MTIIYGDATNLDLSRFRRYGVIVADPPWDHQNQQNAAARNHYPTLPDTAIYTLPVPLMALPDCVLFIWGTWAKQPVVARTMKEWGFEHKTGFPWVKVNKSGGLSYGTGYWFRGCTEYVLVGCRGDVSPPEELANYAGLLAPNLYHSRKPRSVHELAETLPGPYLELFGRRDRMGWDVFGSKVDTAKTEIRPRSEQLTVF